MVSHLKDIRRCDEHDDVDFSNEEEIKRFVRPWKWVSLNVGSVRVLRINVRRVDALSERHIQRTHRIHRRDALVHDLAEHREAHVCHVGAFLASQPALNIRDELPFRRI